MYKVEAIINNVNAYFFSAMQDNDYYIVDGGENFIVLEHSENKSKIRIEETKSGDLFANFKDCLGILYLDHDLYLGDIEVLSFLSKIFEVINNKDFQHFCNDYKNLKIHEGTQTDLTDTQNKIKNLCDKISEILIYKNKMYGNSVLEPKQIFYKGGYVDNILMRLDDKIGRIANTSGGNPIRVNDIVDIIGYLVLLLIAKNVGYSELEKLKD